MNPHSPEVRVSPTSRVFVTFRRWPLVPSAELERLQSTLSQCVEMAGLESARELLLVVTDELQRRTEEIPDVGVVRDES